jgi:hypothetical protein
MPAFTAIPAAVFIAILVPVAIRMLCCNIRVVMARELWSQ